MNLYFLGNHGVINVASVVWGPQRLCHCVALVPRLIFSFLNATIASIYESCISRATASTSKGQGYYYNCFRPLDWHQTLWLIFVRQIGSWGLICIYHVCRGYGLEVCICTSSFFTSFPIQNHSLRLLGTFFSQKNISLLRHHRPLKMLIGGSEVPWGPCPFGPLRMYSARLLAEP